MYSSLNTSYLHIYYTIIAAVIHNRLLKDIKLTRLFFELIATDDRLNWFEAIQFEFQLTILYKSHHFTI